MNTTSPIVITGAGAVCAAGLGVEPIWEAILAGRSHLTPIRSFDTTGWPVAIAAEVQGVDNRTLVEDRKLHKTISRTDLFGLFAAGAAIRQSGLPEFRQRLETPAAEQFDDRSGVFAGSGGGAYESNYEFFPLLTAAAGDLPKFGDRKSVV